jgi:hypothetical protein
MWVSVCIWFRPGKRKPALDDEPVERREPTPTFIGTYFQPRVGS